MAPVTSPAALSSRPRSYCAYRILRVGFDGLAERGNCANMIVLATQGNAQAVVRRGVPRIQLEGTEFRGSGGQIAELSLGQSELEMQLG